MISLSEWERGGTFTTLHGHRLFCREGGAPTQPALVLLHGFPTSSWDFEAIWEELTSHYRVITLDLVGYGFSDKPTTFSYAIHAQADLVEQRLRELGLTEYHLLAHDYGDTVAQELLARDTPTPKLRSVCFLNGGLFPETHRALTVQKLLLSPLGPFIARLTNRARFDQSLRSVFGPRTPPSPEFLEGHWSLLERSVMPQLLSYIPQRVTHRERWVGALQHARIPLKLIDGAADRVSGSHMAARYREVVPAADVTLLEGIGHYPQVEAPRAVLEAYLQFRRATT
ncbi:MAG: alpha/beta hydrolase [Archangium sp.]|nr:alpha/beta hydrolase [Archangium sp.]MDP3158297.1 alpha/beta hydrolase [Archangium sp.]MDP3571940.1 alpha/beta hydrolase [Archangium sp.]